MRRDRRMRRQRREIVAHQLVPGRQRLGVRGLPTATLEQAPRGGVDVVGPWREDPHMAPCFESGARARPALQHQRPERPFDQACRRGQAYGSGPDNDDRKIIGQGARHVIRSFRMVRSYGAK